MLQPVVHHHPMPAPGSGQDWQKYTPDRDGEPAEWRCIPSWLFMGGAKIPPNYYCRGRNAKRLKYCTSRAGANTDHKGEGRCDQHGGNAPTRTGVYSQITVARLGELLDKAAEQRDPTDLTTEIHLMRALVVDYVNRSEAYQDALLAWHASYAAHQRPIAEEKRLAFEELVDEFEIMAQEHGGEYQEALAAKAREFITALSAPAAEKPRKVFDLGDAHRLVDTLSKIVERQERGRAGASFSKRQVHQVVEELGVAVVNRLDELCSVLRNRGASLVIERDGQNVDGEAWLREAVRRDWRSIIVRPPSAGV